jgi:O-methyltransferase involved in polyketide biosynthesis
MLTGHAFQVFLTREDRRAALATIAAHLAPGGRFIFDSREPACREWEEWGPEESRRRLEHPRFGAVQAWNDAAFDAGTGIVTYETHYEIEQTGQRLSAASRIALPTPACGSSAGTATGRARPGRPARASSSRSARSPDAPQALPQTDRIRPPSTRMFWPVM